MTPLEAVLLGVAIGLPLHLCVLRQFDKLGDPAYVRRCGVTIASDSALEAMSAPIGHYLGRPIPGSVTFMGMIYSFDCIVPRGYRHRVAPRQLFLEPGLLYLTT